ncbi:MAG TPA: hypothetical protein DEH78_32385 [Solibacterales bacterium]|nr:hypothetical protein [Bryobacterales bacterium]
MKRKKPVTPEFVPETVVPSELLEQAKKSLESDKMPRRPVKCIVCSSDVAPNSAENLCWVCRRLKISAWRDSDPQMTAQE